MQNRIITETCTSSSNCFGDTRSVESRLPIQQIERLGFCKQEVSWSEANLGQAILRRYIRPAALRAGVEKRFGWHTFRHTYSTLLRSVGTEFKVMQELLRHSSLRSTLDVYTQAISPAKHAAQAAVLGLVFASETNAVASP